MKKVVLIIGCVSLLSVRQSWAQSFLKENFNSVTAPALPANWESIPANTWKTGNPDEIAPRFTSLYSARLATTGYTSAVAINGTPTISDSAVLATPAVSIAAGATAVSAFFNVCFVKHNRETLFFVASTDGGNTWVNVSEVQASQTSLWVRRKIDLSDYAGQNNVRFGFRYRNNKINLVGAAIDNFTIMDGTDLILSGADAGSSFWGDVYYEASGTNTSINGTVLNSSTHAITGYTVKYQQGANAPESYSVTTSLQPLASEGFTHNIPFNVAASNTYPIKVWIEIDNDLNPENDSADITLIGIPQLPEKRIVFEEGTGVWCTWCPRGTVAMDQFAETNPGKATQIAVHNALAGAGSDAMHYPVYVSFLGRYLSGYPSMTVDRTIVDDPSRLMIHYNRYKDQFGFADISLDEVTENGTAVSVKVSIKPAVEINGAKLALVTTESNLSGDGRGWDQVNAYSGGRNGPMGGWENLPSPAHGTKFHFVARDISPSPGGAASGLPETLEAGSTYEATLTATLKEEWKKENLQYIVLLIGEDGNIMNSNFTELPHLEVVISDAATSVSNVAAGINKATLYPNPARETAYLQIDVQEVTKATLTVTDIMGRSIGNDVNSNLKTGNNIISIPIQLLANGTYLVNLTTDNGNVSLKLQIIR